MSNAQLSPNELATTARTLAPGEEIREGDIYLDKFGDWYFTFRAGERVQEKDYQYRRPSDAQPPTLLDFIRAYTAWAYATFGETPDIPGKIAHILKELEEIERTPTDIKEPVDIIFLALHIALNQGHTPEQIAAALCSKLEENKARKWPAPVPGKPTEHIKD